MDARYYTERIIFLVGLGCLFLVLLIRLAYLQLYLGEKYLQKSEKNRIRMVSSDAPRGLIRDRYQKILVDNHPAFTVYAVPAELRKQPAAYDILAAALRTNPQELKRRIKQNKRGNYVPAKIGRHISFSGLSMLYERRLELPGIEFHTESRRAYNDSVRASHLFGYLGEINDAELSHFNQKYNPGELIGKRGLEKKYESILHGIKGRNFVEVDALGRVVRDLSKDDNRLFEEKSPIPGKDILLGIDSALQSMLEKELTDHKGGAVVLNCNNGEILAIVSNPGYDLELFSRPLTKVSWNRLLNDPAKPLYDRMIQSLYPPGSVFKVILAFAGLQTGRIDPAEKVFCSGYYRFGIRKFHCWKKNGHGEVDLMSAIEQSCNVYFYRMGLKVGLKHWADFARKFGFGQTSGIDIEGERAGLVPDQDYLDRRYGAGRWSNGLLLNLAIGQGDLLVTPLQIACLVMAIANEGRSYQPHLKRGVLEPFTLLEEYDEPDSVFVKGIAPQHYQFIRKAMYLVVNGGYGTARGVRMKKIISAGKTGTAQNPHGEPHAWFMGFAPFENPQIAYCIFIENGGSGSKAAAPIAKRMIAYLLKQKKLIANP